MAAKRYLVGLGLYLLSLLSCDLYSAQKTETVVLHFMDIPHRSQKKGLQCTIDGDLNVYFFSSDPGAPQDIVHRLLRGSSVGGYYCPAKKYMLVFLAEEKKTIRDFLSSEVVKDLVHMLLLDLYAEKTQFIHLVGWSELLKQIKFTFSQLQETHLAMSYQELPYIGRNIQEDPAPVTCGYGKSYPYLLCSGDGSTQRVMPYYVPRVPYSSRRSHNFLMRSSEDSTPFTHSRHFSLEVGLSPLSSGCDDAVQQ